MITKLPSIAHRSMGTAVAVVSMLLWSAHVVAAATDITWTITNGVTIAGSAVTKTSADGWNGAGAVSASTLLNTYFVEFRTDPATPPGPGDELVFGVVSSAGAPPSSSSLDHGVMLSGGLAEVFEGGLGTGVSVPYAAGDRFRLEAGLGFFRYRKNGRVFYRSMRRDGFASTLAPAVGLFRKGATITDARQGSPNDARTDDPYFFDYQVPFQDLLGRPLDPPADASAAAASLRQRRSSIVAFEACGREVEFLTTLLQASASDWPEHKTIVGEDALGIAIAKLTWAAGLPDVATGEPQLTPLATVARFQPPYAPCVATVRFTEASLADLAGELGGRLTVPAGAKPEHVLYDDLVNHDATVINRAISDVTTIGPASACNNVVTAAQASSYAAPPGPDVPVVTLEFKVPQSCLVAQITKMIGLMRVVDMPGSSDLPCNLLVGGLTKGEWDTTVKDALRFYFLAKKYETGPTRGPFLDESVFTHLRNDIFTIDGPPDCESYSFTSCGCRNKETGSPADRADDQDFWDKAWDALGDVSDWALRHWFLFLLLLAAVSAVNVGFGVGLSTETVYTVAVITSLASGDTVRIPETENHLLLIHSAKFLTNQIVIDDLHAHGGDASAYEGYQRDVKEWLLKRMQRIMKEDFQEYNARPYQRYSIRALMNLADFSEDDDVRQGADLVLQFAAAKGALSTNGGRRIVPFRRRMDAIPYQELLLQASDSDYMVSMSLLWGGQTQQLPDRLMSVKAADEMITAATSAFTPSLQAFDLFANRDRAYLQRFHHEDGGGMEAYWSTRGFLLTAGGLQTSGNQFAVAGIPVWGLPVDRGAAMPTTFMPLAGFALVSRDDFVQIRGFHHADDDPFDHNTCLWKGFACGVNIWVPPALAAAPARLGDSPTCLGPPSSGENFRFLDSDRCELFNGARDPSYQYDRKSRFYLGVYHRPCLPSSGCDNFGFIDAIAVGDPPSISFGDFIRDETNHMTAWRTESRSDTVGGFQKSGHFQTANGDVVEFNPTANDDDDEDSGIISVNGAGTATIDDWPLAEGDVITVLGDGKLSIRSPNVGGARILDFSDWSHPK